jgi:hypothetical protein
VSRAEEWKDLGFFGVIVLGLFAVAGGIVYTVGRCIPDSPCYESATPMVPGSKGAYCNDRATLEIVDNVAICRCPKEKK